MRMKASNNTCEDFHDATANRYASLLSMVRAGAEGEVCRNFSLK